MADIILKDIVKIYGVNQQIMDKYSKAAEKGRAKKLIDPLSKKRAVDGVNVQIPSGSFTVLVGPSGCGKTTLLRMIAGLEDITLGEIRIGDIDITNLECGERGIAMVFQNYALYPHMTVRENIEFGLVNARIPKHEIKERTEEAIEIVGLDEFAGRKPANLSGGQRQRVALARAISKYPECFLMDEPLSNLDAKLRSDMRTELIHLHQKLNSTFIYVTHDQIEAMTMGDNIVVMSDGKIMQQGSPDDVHNNPNCVFVARFIGDPGMNIVTLDSGYQVGFRPRDIMVDFDGKDKDVVNVSSEIVSFENHGSEFLYLIKSQKEQDKVFIKELSKNSRKVGSHINFGIKRENLYFFGSDDLRVRNKEEVDKAYGEFNKYWQSL